MGAEQFRTTAKGATASEAFGLARDQAAWEYGHGGYTGTIAEKSDFVEYQLPKGLTVEEFERLLGDIGDLNKPFPERTKWEEKHHAEQALLREKYEALSARDKDIISRAAEVYDDKWGPAVAVCPEPGVFVFMGLASS
jgi:hypothetical protein